MTKAWRPPCTWPALGGGLSPVEWLRSGAQIDRKKQANVRAAEADLVADYVGELEAEVKRLFDLVNTPEVDDFWNGVELEAAHQRDRWGAQHDVGKTPFDWFWLLGYLGQKAAAAAVAGDVDKAKHHTISTAAACANWHLALTGADTAMRPGIDQQGGQ